MAFVTIAALLALADASKTGWCDDYGNDCCACGDEKMDCKAGMKGVGYGYVLEHCPETGSKGEKCESFTCVPPCLVSCIDFIDGQLKGYIDGRKWETCDDLEREMDGCMEECWDERDAIILRDFIFGKEDTALGDSGSAFAQGCLNPVDGRPWCHLHCDHPMDIQGCGDIQDHFYEKGGCGYSCTQKDMQSLKLYMNEVIANKGDDWENLDTFDHCVNGDGTLSCHDCDELPSNCKTLLEVMEEGGCAADCSIADALKSVAGTRLEECDLSSATPSPPPPTGSSTAAGALFCMLILVAMQ